MDHVAQTIETYDRVAPDYHVVSTPENRAWLEDSMREFYSRLPGKTVLVAGCGEGRDSRYLQTLGAGVVSFDLSEGMLSLARASDPGGSYLRLDLRNAQAFEQKFDGIWACACLYHLTKAEFRLCLQELGRLLNPDGVLFLNLKLGIGERFIEIPPDGYPGGDVAKTKIRGNRFFAFYTRDELSGYFLNYTVEMERRNHVKEGEGAMEFWLRKCKPSQTSEPTSTPVTSAEAAPAGFAVHRGCKATMKANVKIRLGALAIFGPPILWGPLIAHLAYVFHWNRQAWPLVVLYAIPQLIALVFLFRILTWRPWIKCLVAVPFLALSVALTLILCLVVAMAHGDAQ